MVPGAGIGSTEVQKVSVVDSLGQTWVRSRGGLLGVTGDFKRKGFRGQQEGEPGTRNWQGAGVKAGPGVLEPGLHYSLC